jgi:hypothetical protein
MLPAILTAAVPDWVYSQPDSIDAWVYHGFFRHLETYASSMFPQTYYGSRLGWIVPGYVAYHLFEPAVANFVLHLAFYCVAVASLYVIVRRTAGASSALFVAFAFGLYVPVFRALGSDYVDGPVITYALLAVALGPSGVEKSSPWLTMASGAAVGAMLNSNVGSAFLLPSILVWFVPRRWDGQAWKWLVVQASLWCGGIVLCTTALAVISVATGGSWDFFLQSFRWMRSQGLANPWDVPGLSWIAMAPWVFLPLATALGTVVALLIPRCRAQLDANHVRGLASLGAGFTIFVAFDFIGPGALLYWPFYASWLLPWSFIAIGAALAPAPAHPRVDVATLLVGAGIIGASLMWPRQMQVPLSGFAALGLTVVLLALAVLARTPSAGRLLVAAALVCLHGWLSATAYAPADDRADAFRAIDRGVRIIERYVVADEPRFLLTAPRKLGHYVRGLTSVYLWAYTIASDSFPRVTPQQAARIVPGTTVVVIAEDGDEATKFNEVFAPYGLSGRMLGSDHVDTSHGPLYLTFFEARPVHSADSQTASPTPERP